MLERLWDLFVENMIALFMPLVCSYYALTGDLFLNVSAQNATGCEMAGNTILIPFQYIFAGREAIQQPDGTWELTQRFDYEHSLWTNSILCAAALPPSLILGSFVKGVGYLTEDARVRHQSIKDTLLSNEVQLHVEEYIAMGMAIENPDKAEFLLPEGHKRRAGDERHLAAEKEAMQDITVLLNEAKIPWWVDCGTCLGAYRYGGVIPWDFDLDIAVLLPDFDNVQRALRNLDTKKYIVQDWSSRSHPKSYLKVFIRKTGTLIDIYHFAIDPEAHQIRYILSLDSNMFFPEWWKIRERRYTSPTDFATVFPLKKATFDGIEVYVPNDTKKYLQRYYGENLAPSKIFDPMTGNYEKDLSHPYWQRIYAH